MITEPVVYESVRYFKQGEAFGIVRFNELLKEQVRYHTHDCIEICYVASGYGYHRFGDELQRVTRGDLFIINYGVSHSFYREQEHENLITYNILFKPGFIDRELAFSHDFNSLRLSHLFNKFWKQSISKASLQLSQEEKNEFEPLVDNLYQEYTAGRAGSGSMIRAYMIELIVRIIRGMEFDTANRTISKKVGAINEIVRYLQEHYSESISLGELSAKCFFNKNYFCKVFKEITGVTVTEYVHNLRMEEACKLLEISDKKIVEISLDVGFSDYKAFYTVFNKIVGMPPRDYRKRILEQLTQMAAREFNQV
ncbi:AraC family transcriptional regulator [Paenibacillus agricola]|uniref:AraC family transcriptional regulator n=1 Tax=Paenibacillus agricola TaxID=2716264 RepID=A0ABX0JGS4_9BACL|nr:AraC family transcriptional regulator [Paenibacillus agricola]NHN35372.1 AraC family transcriptional regulator [Paenibacillus agricola]